MGSKQKFQVGQLVYAKVCGYSPWPAMIKKYKSGVYNVIFFGTKQSGTVNAGDVCSYLENTKKYNTLRNLKRPDYARALAQIEDVINGENILDIYNKCSNYNAANKQLNKKTYTKDAISLAQETACGSHSASQISRKRNYDEGKDLNLSAAPAKKRILRDAKKRVKSQRGSTCQREMPNHYLNIVLAKVPGYKRVGILVDYGKPVCFENEELEMRWMEESRNEAEELKLRLEFGYIHIREIAHRVIIDPPLSRIPTKINDGFMKSLIDLKAQLRVKHQLLMYVGEIRESLHIKGANTGRCLQILKKFQQLEPKKITLIRHPEIVHIIRQLRNYVGNLKEWDLDDEEKAKFLQESELIRKEAAQIYNKLETVLQFPDDFVNAVKLFKKVTEKMSAFHVDFLTDETYQKLLQLKEGQ